MLKATRQGTKDHNSRLILNTIYHNGGISRADIARKTRLTRPTVSSIVAELIEDRLVVETGLGPSAGGKPPTLLNISENAFQCICADLGNQEFRGAIVNLRGKILQRFNIPIDNQNGDIALECVYQLVDNLISIADNPVLGIGIGTPGLMDAQRGVVRNAVNLDWCDLPLGKLLEDRYDLPAYIANDCQAAALGEFTFGESENSKNMIVIKIGRGIGAGIIINGKLYYGDNFGAGEIGHMVVADNGERCRCGNYGCLETIVSSRAIIKNAQILFTKDPSSQLHQYVSSPDQINVEVVNKAYLSGDKAIQLLIDEVGKYLGKAISNLVSTLNIQHIIIAGDFICLSPVFSEKVRQEVKKRTLPALANETHIEVTCLGEDIVTLGAAALILQNELGIK